MQCSITPYFGAKIEPKKSVAFRDCITPAYTVSRVFGLFPFTIVYDSNGHVQKAVVYIRDVIWFIGSISLNFVSIYTVVSRLKFLFSMKSPLLVNANNLLMLFVCTLSTISIIFDLINRDRLVKMCRDLSAIDEKVSK